VPKIIDFENANTIPESQKYDCTIFDYKDDWISSNAIDTPKTTVSFDFKKKKMEQMKSIDG